MTIVDTSSNLLIKKYGVVNRKLMMADFLMSGIEMVEMWFPDYMAGGHILVM